MRLQIGDANRVKENEFSERFSKEGKEEKVDAKTH
jgi:hypothetical protein